jgi:hypothetical protein
VEAGDRWIRGREKRTGCVEKSRTDAVKPRPVTGDRGLAGATGESCGRGGSAVADGTQNIDVAVHVCLIGLRPGNRARGMS